MKMTVAAIDFGTSKIVTLIGESGGYSGYDIVGFGSAQYDGYIDGQFNDPANLDRTIAESITAAEEQSRQKVREIFVGVPGEFIRVETRQSELTLKSSNRPITNEDIERVVAFASEGMSIPGGEIIHSSPSWFSVDGGKHTMEPLGQKGEKLSACVAFIAVDKAFIQNISARLEKMTITAVGFFSTSLGQALLIVPLEERDHSCALIDVGYLSTEVAVIEGDALVYHDIIPMGGAHMTADLVYGLEVPMKVAEQVKRSYTFGINAGNASNIEIVVDGEPLSFPHEQVASIIEPRAEEMVQFVSDSLRQAGMEGRSSIYLTGGGLALMRGGREFMSFTLSRPVKVTLPRSPKLNSPIYASALGLIEFAFDVLENETTSGSIAGKVMGFFKGLLGKQ